MRSDITVPDTYAQGDFIKCGGCATQHKIIRGDNLRLVLADTGPMKESLRQNRALIERLEKDLAAARGVATGRSRTASSWATGA